MAPISVERAHKDRRPSDAHRNTTGPGRILPANCNYLTGVRLVHVPYRGNHNAKSFGAISMAYL